MHLRIWGIRLGVKSLSLRSPIGSFPAALSLNHRDHGPSWRTPLISSDLYTWVTVCREQGMGMGRGERLGHTLQWVENIFGMSIQTCLLGGVLRSLSLDIAGVNQALRQMGQITHWTRFFRSYYFKLSTIYESHRCPGLYSVNVFMVIFITICATNIASNESLDSGPQIEKDIQKGTTM